MNNERLREAVGQAIGEISALFMSQECKGTEIIMPTEELMEIQERILSLLSLREQELWDKIEGMKIIAIERDLEYGDKHFNSVLSDIQLLLKK